MKIGKIELQYGLMLGPMAGYTDRAMRCICRRYGAEYAVTEMVSAKAVCYGDRKTAALARILPDEGPVALQIFGSEPSVMAEGAALLLARSTEGGGARPAAIDINMGCPVRKIFCNGEGSALMRDPGLILRIVSAVSAAVDLPVSVKLRAGIDAGRVNAVECALAAEEGGAAFVTVHGRTREQMYAGRSDPAVIAAVKRALRVPVVANGDVSDAAGAERLLLETGADALMIARGAVGNPFLFAQIRARMRGEDCPPPEIGERISVALDQLALAVAEKGEAVAVAEGRKQIAAYFTGERGSAALRAAIHRCDGVGQIRAALHTFVTGLTPADSD